MIIGIWSNVVYPHSWLQSILIIIIVCFFLLSNHRLKKIKISQTKAKKLINLILMIIICIQFLIINCFKASIYHDPFRILFQADLLSRQIFNWHTSNYFYYYPNNIGITFLLSEWLKLTGLFKIDSNIATHLICLITTDIFIYLTIKVVEKINLNPLISLTTAVFFLLTPFAYTYLLQVFYSDILLLISVVGILLAFLSWNKDLTLIKKVGLLISTFICGLVGMVMKPSIIVIVAAALIAIILIRVFTHKWEFVVPVIFMILGMGSAPLVNHQIVNEVHFKPNTEYQLPVNSWIYMGLNDQAVGTYSQSDVKAIEKIPDKERSSKVSNLIKQRVKELGIIKTFKQWVGKIEVCENVGTVQGAYMSGNYQAPRWFLNCQGLLSALGSIVFRSFIILLMITIIRQSYLQRFSNSWFEVFIKLSLLGFIAFYSLIWETECRYGLILIPFYWILISLSEKSSIHSTDKKNPTLGVIFYGLIIGLLTLNVSTPTLSKNIDNFSGVVTAQNSQLSSKYKAKETWIPPQSSIIERVELKKSANYFAMIVPQRSRIKVELINKSTNQKFKLLRKKGVAFHRGTLSQGTYWIEITNKTATDQRCAIVDPPAYKLATYTVKGISNIKNGYFIYSFETRKLK